MAHQPEIIVSFGILGGERPSTEPDSVERPWVVEGDFGYQASFVHRGDAIRYADEIAEQNNAVVSINE